MVLRAHQKFTTNFNWEILKLSGVGRRRNYNSSEIRSRSKNDRRRSQDGWRWRDNTILASISSISGIAALSVGCQAPREEPPPRHKLPDIPEGTRIQHQDFRNIEEKHGSDDPISTLPVQTISKTAKSKDEKIFNESEAYSQNLFRIPFPDLNDLLPINSTLCEGVSSPLGPHNTGFLEPKARLRNFRTVQRLDWAATKRPLTSKYKWRKDQILGQGAYGKVYLAHDKATGEKVALKQIPKEHTTDLSFQQEMRAMLYIRSKGGHPHVCGLHEHFDDSNDYFVILDYIGGGEMFDHLIQNGAYSEMDAARLIRDVASALNFLHGIGVVHSDLKPENLLLTTAQRGDSVVKIADFGCAQLLEHADEDFAKEDYEAVYGAPTPAYCPPETIEKTQPLQPATDMWALGVILFIMLTGSHPFDLGGNATDDEIEDRILDPAYRVPINRYSYTGHLSRPVKDLMRKLLHPDPNKRITAYQVLQHPWIRGERNVAAASDPIARARSFFQFATGAKEEEDEKQELASSEHRSPNIQRFRTHLEAKFFESAIHWSEEQEDDFVQKRTSLIERSFQAIDHDELLGGVDGDGEPVKKETLNMSHFSNLLADNIKHKHFIPGQVIFREGDKGHHMYFIDSGSVKVECKDGSVVTRHQGDFFGEAALLHPQNLRSDTVTCQTPVHALEISREYFEKYLSTSKNSKVLMTLKEKDRLRKRDRAKAILRLQNNMQEEEIKFNETFFDHGDKGDSMFVLESGKVDVSVNDNLVFSALPGNVFGEHSLLSGRPRNCTAKCVSKDGCAALELLGKDFRQLAETSPHIQHSLRDLQLRREFKKAVVSRSHKPFPYQNPEEAFQIADHKDMGELDIEAVKSLLNELSEEYTDAEIQGVLASLDLTSSGKVSYDEFKKCLIR